MKRCAAAVLLALLCFAAAACDEQVVSTPPETTPPATTIPLPTESIPVPTTVPVTTVPPTTATPILTGWQNIDGHTYFYRDDGTPATGWQEVASLRYFFDGKGRLYTGWLELDGKRYYLGADGAMVTGSLTLYDKQYYLDQNGVMQIGWQTDALGICRYFGDDGAMVTGWLDVDGQRYYLDEDGAMATGWLQQGEDLYYLRQDGTMARGCVQIDGVNTYFTSSGAYILLVNPWNALPEGYAPELVTLDRYNGYNNMLIARCCYDALVQMLRDCKAQCQIAYVVSSYRTHEFQTKNYQRKVNYYLNLGYSQADAEVLAAKVVAVPGTSEHQSGLAVDIVDGKLWVLEEEQADMPAQKWLMENSWKYGFILRYPKDKTDITGIIYEPWHYRYVGLEVAAELHESGLTLEEYLDALTAAQES